MGCGQSTLSGATTPEEPHAATTTTTTTTTTTKEAPSALDMRHVRNIFAKPLQQLAAGVTGGVAAPPHWEKTPEETAFLLAALPRNFVFEHVAPGVLEKLIGSFEPCEITPAGTVIIQQGDPTGDYFYVLKEGSVDFLVNGVKVGSASDAGASFGELSLLYSAPRAATVQTTAPQVRLYRLDQITFRSILQQQQVSQLSERMAVLRQVQFLKDLDDYSLYKVAAVATEQTFGEGTVIVHKGDTNADICYILVQGEVCCSEISVGGGASASSTCQYENVTLHKVGDYFGERALMTGEPRAATVTATSAAVTCFTIDKTTFLTVLGDLQAVVAKANEERTLSAIPLIANSKLSFPVRQALARGLTEQTFAAGTVLYTSGTAVAAPALYLVRTGSVTMGGTQTVGAGGYFGDDQLRGDVGLEHLPDTYVAKETVVAGPDGVTCGVLTLAVVRTLVDTRYMGQEPPKRVRDSLLLSGGKNVRLDQLPRHAVLGAGTFGMVFLVSRENALGERIAYAMKVQSKFELCRDGQAEAVICEKNIMSQLQHPFLAGLICSYQDDNFVYLLLQLIQGGELYSYMHNTKHDWLDESAARFYAACIAEGLGYMHQRGYCYRDLKPENVLVDASGYCVIIDFGFAKYVPIPTKTFTLCGTPLYIPPEVILNRGHDGSADHWSFGVLIYEMLLGDTPFYTRGMEQLDLFRAIVKCRYTTKMEGRPAVSEDAGAIISGLIVKDPSQRLGSLAAGEEGILQHAWFAKHGMDMEQLRQKKYTAPTVPKIKDPLDSSNFDNWDHLEDKTKKKFPALNREEKKLFEKF